MDWILGFVLGFVADLFRSVFLPATTDWLNRFIPSAREKTNAKDNVVTLDVMTKLQSLGFDPALAQHFKKDSGKFLDLLVSQRDAFVVTTVEAIESAPMTQLEMNEEAKRRAEIARTNMERALADLQKHEWFTEKQRLSLESAQANWEQFAKSQAILAANEFDGGSMWPLVYWNAMDTLVISRTGELNLMFKEIGERNN